MENTKTRLAKGYSRSAPLYDVVAGHLYVAGLRRLLPRLRRRPGYAILDVGCGTGVNLLEAARWFAPTRYLCGIDISPGMVEVARTKAAMFGVPAQFTVADAEQLPYPDGSFDLVICNSVFHWFKDRAAALREMYRVLRPGGQLVLICAAAPGFREWFGLVDQIMHAAFGQPGLSAVPALPSVFEVGSLMQASGFMIEHLANPTHVQRIYQPEGFVRLMATVAPQWTADLNEEVQFRLEQIIAAVMRSGWPAGFPNTWSAVEAVGTRVV